MTSRDFSGAGSSGCNRVAFVVDLSGATFHELDEMLAEVCDGMDGTGRGLQEHWPPTQEKECMAVTALNLLNLQVMGWGTL